MSYFAGIDQLPLECLAGCRCALLTNAGALDATGRRSVEALRANGVELAVLFSPEHGLEATVADGVAVANQTDALSGLPVVSLYGAKSAIPQEWMAHFDKMVIDLPDVGVRYYTYPNTVFTVLDDCAKAGKPVVLLDRANPLGKALEGPFLEMSHASPVGRFSVPVRHGMTLGEYAQLAVRKFGVAPGVELMVVPPRFDTVIKNPMFPDFGRAWKNPSPNLRSFEALCCYPGTCLFEGTDVSEGRGTAYPFQLIGAPYVNSRELLKNLGGCRFPGLILEEASFIPDTNKYAGQLCNGVFFHVIDHRQCRAFEAAMRILDALWNLYPGRFTFRSEHFDHLLGSSRYRLGCESLEELLDRAEKDCADFCQS